LGKYAILAEQRNFKTNLTMEEKQVNPQVVPSLFLEPKHMERLHSRMKDAGSDIYKRELEKANKTREEGLTIIDYCINHGCYVHEVCAILGWDVSLMNLVSLRMLQDRLMQEGSIKRRFVI
jgi:hypothetical protein